MTRSRTLVALALLAAVPAFGQGPDSTLLSIDRLFASGDFAGQRVPLPRWIKEGNAYTVLEPSPDIPRARDVVRYETATGARTVLVPARRLLPPGAARPLTLDGTSWSRDGKRALIFTNTRRVWRQNTRGDYYLYTLADSSLRKLGGDAPPSTLMFAEFSPDGKRVAYVRENNLYVEDVETGELTALTHDGSRTIINGTFDWVYEEEFKLRQGFRWSPDGSMIAYWQLDAAGVPDFLLLNSTDSLYAFTIPVQYPKVGATLSACRVGVVRASGGATVWMQSPGDPRNTYIAHMEWTPDGREIVFQHLNRKQTTLRLMAGDIATGTVRTLLTEADSAWIDVVDDMRWFKDGASFAWISEATGWRNVVQVSRDGKPLRTLTPGKYDVIDLLALDEKAGFLYFIASPENATRRFLYRTRLDGRGHPERITPAGLNGYHSYEIAPNGRWAVHSWSTIDTPAATELVALPGHAVVRPLNDNALLKARVAALLPTPASFFRVDIGNGVVLDGWKILPAGFDSTKRYPVLFHVYGEPGGQTVIDRFGGTTFLWHRMLAQQGYIVVSVDNRGTPAPRGRSWRSCVYQKIGTLSSADQAAAARVIRRWPYVDSTRIGIWGWSGGGSTTLNMLFRYPELYHTGVAVAPVADLRLYDAVYQERYTGLLDESPDAYTQGSPITFAAHLRGNLLVIHGTGDDNVHYQGTERLINALVAANRQFSMLAYPNRSHGIFERENTTRHLYTAITEYLRAHLPPGAGR